MIALDNDLIKRLAFLQMLEWLAAGDTAPLEKAGLSKEAIERIRRTEAKDVPGLSKMLDLGVSVNSKSLDMNFLRQEMAEEDQRALEYFIENHATPAMIKRFFRTVGSRDINQLRNRFGSARMGRTPVLDDKTAICVFEAWRRLTGLISNECRRYVALHQEFSDWPLSTLYVAINETVEYRR